MPNFQKGFAPIIILVVILVVLIISVGYYFYSKFNQQSFTSEETNSIPVDTSSNETSNWKIFKNEERGYQFSYPEGVKINSDMGMNFSTDSIFLYSEKRKLPYFGVQSITKSDLQSGNYQIGKVTSVYELIKNSYEQTTSNKSTFIKTVEPVHEVTISGRKAYTYKVEDNGVAMIYGESLKDKALYTYIATENKDSFILINYAGFELFNQILSTFKFNEPVAGLIGVPLITGSQFIKKEFIAPCPGEQSVCGTDSYLYISPGSFDGIVSWYEKDESKSGWKLTGGAGASGVNRFGTYSDGKTSYWLTVFTGSDNLVKVELRGPLK